MALMPMDATVLLKRFTAAWVAFPAAKALWDGLTGGLGANPVEALINRAGFWAATFLAASLVPTAVRMLTGHARLLKVRRILGLAAFFHALTHLLIYVGADQQFAPAELWADVVKRKFMTVGMAAFVLLLPLAVTSTKKAMVRLGSQWQRLHRLSYVAAGLVVIHFVWRVKADLTRPGMYGALVVALLLVRLGHAALQARRRLVAANPAPPA